MLIRNLGDERFISSSTHDFHSGDVPTGGEIEVPDALGKSLCEQADIWERVKTTKADKSADKAGE